MIVRELPEAFEEIYAATCWYEDNRTGLGEQFLAAVKSGIERISETPQTLPFVEFAPATREFRRCSLRGFPWSIYFQVRQNEILIVAVAHHHRMPGYWLTRLEG